MWIWKRPPRSWKITINLGLTLRSLSARAAGFGLSFASMLGERRRFKTRFSCRAARGGQETLSWNGHRKERSYVRSREPGTSDTRPVASPELDPGSQMRMGSNNSHHALNAVSMNAEKTLVRRVSAMWRDNDGLMAPYVAVMLPVLVGFALLGVDAARRMSLQTQMQAAADSLALAGARELNRQPGAEARAQSAMANAYASTKSPNTLLGVVPAPTLTYTFAFYSSLAAASDGIGGAAASGDADAKYLAVTVTPQTLSTIIPASFLANVSTDAFAVGAEAAAGFAGTTVCSVAPLFVCNPYEASEGSMTDAQATAALNSAIDNPAILRRQLKLNRNGIGPGHFGWLNTPDGCDNAACMASQPGERRAEPATATPA